MPALQFDLGANRLVRPVTVTFRGLAGYFRTPRRFLGTMTSYGVPSALVLQFQQSPLESVIEFIHSPVSFKLIPLIPLIPLLPKIQLTQSAFEPAKGSVSLQCVSSNIPSGSRSVRSANLTRM